MILDTSTLPKRVTTLENLSFVYDTPRQNRQGLRNLTLGLLTPHNFYPMNVGHHFSQTPGEGQRGTAPQGQGRLARRLRDAKLTKPALAVKMLKGGCWLKAFRPPISWWTPGLPPPPSVATSMTWLQIIGRLKRDRTLYYRAGIGYTLEQLYQAHKHRLVKDATSD